MADYSSGGGAYPTGLGLAGSSSILDEARSIAATPGPTMGMKPPAVAAPTTSQRIFKAIGDVGDLATNVGRGFQGRGLNTTELNAQKQNLANAQLEGFTRQLDLVNQAADVARRSPDSIDRARSMVQQNAPLLVDFFDAAVSQKIDLPKSFQELERFSPTIRAAGEAFRGGLLTPQQTFAAVQQAMPEALENKEAEQFNSLRPAIRQSFDDLQKNFPEKISGLLRDKTLTDSELAQYLDLAGVDPEEQSFLMKPKNKQRLIDTIAQHSGVDILLGGEDAKKLEVQKRTIDLKAQARAHADAIAAASGAGKALRDVRVLPDGTVVSLDKRAGTVTQEGRVTTAEKVIQTTEGVFATGVDESGKAYTRELRLKPEKLLESNVIDLSTGETRMATEAEVRENPSGFVKTGVPKNAEKLEPGTAKATTEIRATYGKVLQGMKALEGAPIGAIGTRGDVARGAGVMARGLGLGGGTANLVSTLFAGGETSPEQLTQIQQTIQGTVLPAVKAFVQSDTSRLTDTDYRLGEQAVGGAGLGNDVVTLRAGLGGMMRMLLTNDNLNAIDASRQGAEVPPVMSVGAEDGISPEEARKRRGETLDKLVSFGFDYRTATEAIAQAKTQVLAVKGGAPLRQGLPLRKAAVPQEPSEPETTPMPKDRVMEILRKNSDKNFVQRVLRSDNFPKIQRPDIGNGWISSHLMAAEDCEDEDACGTSKFMVFPTIVQEKPGQPLRWIKDLREAQRYAYRTGQFIGFDSLDEAISFSTSYKHGLNADAEPK